MPLSVRSGIDQGDLALSFAHLMRDDLACAVLIFDRDQRVLFHSPNLARLLELKTESLVGAHASTLPMHIRDLVQRAVQSGQFACDTEFLERPDKRTHNLRLTALPLRDAQASGLTAILVQDLSRAQQLEDDLRQLDRLVSMGTLAAEMAHEVKNALVAVKTFVDLLLEKNPGNDLEQTVRRELNRIDAIVAQVLNFARNAAPASRAASLHTVIERTLKMLQRQFESRGITVVSRLAATPDRVMGDENHLEQALLNLLLNATEAMNGQGTLSLETDLVINAGKDAISNDAPRQIRLVIRDTGCGIPSESMKHLFEPFYTTKKNGTGLGLAITRRIIHEHGGIISAESEPGKGAAFHILLPAVA